MFELPPLHSIPDLRPPRPRGGGARRAPGVRVPPRGHPRGLPLRGRLPRSEVAPGARGAQDGQAGGQD